jgi:uncharacterized membrane-anchored protein
MEIITIGVSALVVNMITDVSKRWSFNPRWVVLGLSILCGAIWYIFQAYLPMSLQVEVQNFILGTMAGAVFIHEFFSKHFE